MKIWASVAPTVLKCRSSVLFCMSAKQHILVADSSKFGVVRSAYFCDLEDIDIVITDTGLSPEWRNILQERGVTLSQV